MYSITYSLSFSLDKDGINSIDLIISNSLYKLDLLLKKYKNNKEIRAFYDEEISEFCLVNRELIEKENERNKRNRTGEIVIFERYYDKSGKLVFSRPVRVMYGEKSLPSREICLEKIRRTLEDAEKLKKFFYTKAYLLNDNEKNSLWLYFRDNKIEYYEHFICSFIEKIRMAKPSYAYWICRMLVNLCDLEDEVIDDRYKEREKIICIK